MLIPFEGRAPRLGEGVWVAPTAVVAGDVEIGARSSVWFSAVVRGDEAPIRIGADTNVQDGCILHTRSGDPLVVGDRVSVGHLVVLHGCHVHDGALIGIGSVILDGAVIGAGCIVAAGSLVTGGARFEERQLILGRPAKAVRPVTDAEIADNLSRAERYARNAAKYGRAGGGPTP